MDSGRVLATHAAICVACGRILLLDPTTDTFWSHTIKYGLRCPGVGLYRDKKTRIRWADAMGEQARETARLRARKYHSARRNECSKPPRRQYHHYYRLTLDEIDKHLEGRQQLGEQLLRPWNWRKRWFYLTGVKPPMRNK